MTTTSYEKALAKSDQMFAKYVAQRDAFDALSKTFFATKNPTDDEFANWEKAEKATDRANRAWSKSHWIMCDLRRSLATV